MYLNDSLNIHFSYHMAYCVTRRKSQSPSQARGILHNLAVPCYLSDLVSLPTPAPLAALMSLE